MTTANVTHFNSVQPDVATRFSTGIEELDWLYGHNDGGRQYGMPRGVLSLWGGAAGIGKTRASMQVVRNLLGMNKTVLCFTLETTQGQFVEKYCKDMPPTNRLFISEDKALNQHIQAIQRYNPDLIVVDSVNQIEECTGSRGAKKVEAAYRSVVASTGSHVIFITHLNAKNTVKGGTALPHMVDIVFTITPFDITIKTDLFVIGAPQKHRFGKTGIETIWAHHKWGVECQSDFRFEDADWLKAKGMRRPSGRTGLKKWLFG